MLSLSAYFTSAAILWQSYASSQETETPELIRDRVYNYKLVIEAPIYECDILGCVKDSTPLQVAEPGAVFTIVGKKIPDFLIIRFWKWKENTALNLTLCYADSLGIKRKYFLLSQEDLNCKAIAGITLIPASRQVLF